jgi:ectoine hydroxylase-related dioxygenase (phytanoyl-CoA dioxygenase family)
MGLDAAMLRAAECKVEDLASIVAEDTVLADYPLATRVEAKVLVYAAEDLRGAARRVGGAAPVGLDRQASYAELARALREGPGVVIIEGAMDPAVVDRATEVFFRIIDEQNAAGQSVGDHFAKPGANDRIWNSLEKLAVADPAVFVDYHGNDIIDLVSTAWLGPAYQMTAQVNVVNPGGAAQVPHRDYHLGFMSSAQIEDYPDHVHDLSPALTLQGAIAHGDTPLETGPTMLLPHSQKYPGGYLISGREDFAEFTTRHCVQVPFAKGDAIFFNPALIHGAGTNRTADVRRMVNLLQVSSAFGRAMESVDRERVVLAIYPELLERGDDPRAQTALRSAAEGYPFPTNLDRDPPVGGLAPRSQADVVRAALAERRTPEELRGALKEHATRRETT